MTYIFRTSKGQTGTATKGKDKIWTCKINGYTPFLYLYGGTVSEMKRCVREDYPKATFQKVSRR